MARFLALGSTGKDFCFGTRQLRLLKAVSSCYFASLFVAYDSLSTEDEKKSMLMQYSRSSHLKYVNCLGVSIWSML